MNQGMLGVWESVQTLRELISRERDGRKCLRLQLLYLLATQQATNRTTAAKLLGINRQTLGQWLTEYEEGGLASLLEIERPRGLPSSLPDFVIEAMRIKLLDPVGFPSFQALQTWVQQRFQIQTSYRIIHYTASKILGARLAVGRRSHVKKKRAMRRPFIQAFKLAWNWQSKRLRRSIGKLQCLRQRSL